VSLGYLVALVVLLCCLVLAIVGRMELLTAALIAGLAVAVLLGPVVVPWRTG
jgi:hypothetical protein